ncbi:hypothetical protein L596_024827 [Steinernema carpocapsae]|uniref:Sugar transporter SWEET n=1 Tax=Steinernema carpocapsae TaxID=34508 RepID=A0A4U5M628_STECR|nr:hypothetical protein L596_024827 [Steinernema carpocapsae]
MFEDVALVDALSFSAITSTVALFLCGLEICQRIQRKGSTEGVDAAPFLLTFISCTFWTQYGVLKEDSTIICINFIGIVIEAAYLYYYYRMTRNRRRLNRILLFEVVLFLGMYGYTTSAGYELKDRISNLGFVCMLMNIASLGSPLLGLRQTESISVSGRRDPQQVHGKSPVPALRWEHGRIVPMAPLRHPGRRYLHQNPQRHRRGDVPRPTLLLRHLPLPETSHGVALTSSCCYSPSFNPTTSFLNLLFLFFVRTIHQVL